MLLLATALALQPSCAQAAPAAENGQMIFSDDFSAGNLDHGKWTTCYPWWARPSSGCTNEGNDELEWYLPGQLTISRGTLHLTASRNPVTGTARNRRVSFPFRSGMVATAGHFSFQYGRVSMRARAPVGAGLWPGLWLAPASGKWPPEIDIMEAFGNFPMLVLLTYHQTASTAPQAIVPLNINDWHTYQLQWGSSSIRWYIDGQLRFTVNQGVPHVPMYLLATLAVSGQQPHAANENTPKTATFDVSNVRVWSR